MTAPEVDPSLLPEANSLITRIALVQQAIDRREYAHADSLFSQILSEPLPISNALKDGIARLAIQLQRHATGIEIFASLVAEEPDNLNYLEGLAVGYMQAQRYPEAEHFLLRMLHINPDFVPAIEGYGVLLNNVKQYSKACPYLERALQAKPDDPGLLVNVAISLNHMGRYTEAVHHLQKSIRFDPNRSLAHYMLGYILGELGQSERAIEAYQKAIELEADYGAAYFGIAHEKKFTPQDTAFIEQAESILQQQLPAEARGFVHFALGKIYDDLKEWDQAFSHFRRGNLLRKPSKILPAPYDEVKYLKKNYLENKNTLAAFGNTATSPVFIIGMPRSGSTLAEQIISRHPAASTAGELSNISELAVKIFRQKPPLPITGEFLQTSATDYLKTLSEGREQYLRIIDKSPGNFTYIGLLLLMFPNARFIHTIRHPLDTCLSCYFQAFDQVHWATDLGWIAQSYCYYRDAIREWQSVLPAGTITDFHYEQLVANPEEETKRLVAAAGLEWHPACLEHYKTEGSSVRTASTWQVRQPIYQSSRMRWIHYASHLGELAQGITPYLTEQDKDILAQHGVKLRPASLWSRLSQRLR